MTQERGVVDALDENADRVVAAVLTDLIYRRAHRMSSSLDDVSLEEAIDEALDVVLPLYDRIVGRVAELASVGTAQHTPQPPTTNSADHE